ncbi:MAG: L,D-transpeptidase [Chloroflexota bacterium]
MIRGARLLALAVSTAALLAACAVAANPVSTLVAATHTPPLAPTNLRAVAAGHGLAPGGWTNQPTVVLAATLKGAHPGVRLVPEAELEPAGQPFTGIPNAVGAAGNAAITSPAMSPGQRYHWQIRAREPGGPAGPWVPFEGRIGFQPNPPPPPSISAVGHAGVVARHHVQVHWTADGGTPGVAGFSYSVDRQSGGSAPRAVKTRQDSAALALPADGAWFLHLRTLDRAGNWSAAATSAIQVDTIPLKVSNVFYRTFAYNPGFGLLPIAFGLSKPASVTVNILPGKGTSVVRSYSLGQRPAGKVTLGWDGKDAQGVPVPSGSYRFDILATDKAGRKLDLIYDKLSITDKRIVVSLGQQKLTAYAGPALFLQSLVTTGGPLLPTPLGTYQILDKQAPFTFHSPWPKGNPLWYPDSPTHFAMMFDTGGYFIHDAPWRGKFGPGSNLVASAPGTDTTGTHGCVNVPLDVQTRLFAWTDPGTPVIIQP